MRFLLLLGLVFCPGVGATDLVVAGWRSHAEFQEIRQRVEENLPDGVYLVERSLARGTVTFALKPDYAADELRKLIAVMELSDGKLTVTSAHDSLVEARYDSRSGPR